MEVFLVPPDDAIREKKTRDQVVRPSWPGHLARKPINALGLDTPIFYGVQTGIRVNRWRTVAGQRGG